MKSQAFAVVEPSNYVGIIPSLIEYSISMELNDKSTNCKHWCQLLRK